MLRVLHVTEAFGGGIFSYIKSCVNWQVEKYEVYIGFSKNNLALMPENYKEQLDSRVHLCELKEIKRTFNPLAVRKAIRRLRELTADIKPDIVHLHASFAGFHGRLAINDKNIKLFYSPHSYGFAMKDRSGIERILYKGLEKYAGKKNCLTIAISGSEYVESMAVTKQSICINSGIDTEAFKKYMKAANLNHYRENTGNDIRIFMSGRICPQKNPKQFNRIAQSFPDNEFVWIGDGKQRNELTSKNISITGWLSRTEVVAQILNSDIFLFTTLWEGLSQALLECMYMGKVCIVMDAGGNRDVVENGINGFLCYSDDEMINALKDVISGRVDTNAIANAAHTIVRDEYNTVRMNKLLSDVYMS